MFLSIIEFNPSASKNPYDWHRFLWDHFPGRGNEVRNFLFRMEGFNLENGKTKVLLQSDIFPESIGTESVRIKEPKLFDSGYLAQDAQYRFKLTANPIKMIKDKDDPNRKVRVPLIQENQQIDWIKRKLEGVGQILDVIVCQNPPIYFRKKHIQGKLVPVTFEGSFRIQNPQYLFELMCRGIGPAKAFGCGLLTVARLRSCN